MNKEVVESCEGGTELTQYTAISSNCAIKNIYTTLSELKTIFNIFNKCVLYYQRNYLIQFFYNSHNGVKLKHTNCGFLTIYVIVYHIRFQNIVINVPWIIICSFHQYRADYVFEMNFEF